MADFCRDFDPEMWAADPLRDCVILCEGHARMEALDAEGRPIFPPPENSYFADLTGENVKVVREP